MDDDLTDEERAESLRYSIRHLASHAQTMCGYRAEMCECGLEGTGEFHPAEMDEDEYDEIFEVLLSCMNVEEVYGPSPSAESPNLVASMKAHFFGDELETRRIQKAAVERRVQSSAPADEAAGLISIGLSADQWRNVDAALGTATYDSAKQQETVLSIRDLIASELTAGNAKE